MGISISLILRETTKPHKYELLYNYCVILVFILINDDLYNKITEAIQWLTMLS